MNKCKCGSAVCVCMMIAKVLLVVGGLNWGLVGVGMLLNSASSWNLVNLLFGSMPTLESIVYLLVGISAIVNIFGCKCTTCKIENMDSPQVNTGMNQ